MSKKQIDRHVDPNTVSFTFLVDEIQLIKAAAIAKKEDRTKGSVLREALRLYLEGRSA